MTKKSISFYLILFCLIPFFQTCSTLQTEREYDHKLIKDIPINSGKLSRITIDNEPTFEIIFKLRESTDCMRITVLASYFTDTMPKSRIAAKSFFLLERLIDISQFKKANKKTVYTTIAQNYNTQWEQKPTITICTLPEHPLAKLDNTSFYRLRFSPLSKEQFSFKVTLESDSEIQIIGN